MIVSKGLLKKLESIYTPIYVQGNCDPHNDFKNALNSEFGSSISRQEAKTVYYVVLYNLCCGADLDNFNLEPHVAEIFAAFVEGN